MLSRSLFHSIASVPLLIVFTVTVFLLLKKRAAERVVRDVIALEKFPVRLAIGNTYRVSDRFIGKACHVSVVGVLEDRTLFITSAHICTS
jgi:hypothetical protein